MQPVRQPDDALHRIVEHAGTETGLLDDAVALADRARPPQRTRRRVARRDPLGADDDPGIGRVVGDRVAHGARAAVGRVDAVRASVDQFERGHDVIGGRVHVGRRDVVPIERVAEHEGELHLDLRVEVVRGADRRAGLEEHVVEQRTEVGLVDLHRHLHRPAGEPDLVTRDRGATGKLQIDPRGLDRVRVGERDVGERPGHRIDRHGGDPRLLVGRGELVDLRRAERAAHRTCPSAAMACVS